MKIDQDNDLLMYDTSPVEFDPFAEPVAPPELKSQEQQEANSKVVYTTAEVDFDPFGGPEIVLFAPATEPQVEIWTSCLIGGDAANCAYNESASLLLSGYLDKNAMMRALLDVVNMHQALRMTFSADGANICVYKEFFLDVDYQDISNISPNEQKQFIDEYNKKAILTPFDLIHGPLFKTSLFKVSDQEHYLTFVAHHIICDGWSMGIILQDLSSLYSAYTNNRNISLPPAPLFTEYAIQQEEFKTTTEYKETEQFWVDQFNGSNHLLDLPTDYSRPTLRTYKSHRLDLVMDKTLASEIKKLAKTNGSSFVTTLMAAFEVFLKQVTGQDDIILGLPAAGQSATENFRLVGHCVNLLALRSFPKSNISFKDYLKQRKSQVLDAYDHQLYTFGSLLKKLNIARDPSRPPLVPVMFNIDMGLDNDVEFYGIEHHLSSIPREYENFEIFINIAGHEEAPTLEWSYNTQLFKSSTIEKMMDDFEFLLNELVKDPNILLGNIPTQHTGELLKQLNSWNDTAAGYPKQPLHNLISGQAAKTPEKTAITFGKSKISYKELNEQANRLAAVLAENGVKRGDKVAFSIDRSIEMVITMLAIIKTGAAYIPLDPQFPLNRINYMIEDSAAVLLLTSKKYSGRYESKARELNLDEIWTSLKNYPSSEPETVSTPNDLAYILYTSGSTGMPKGVQIAHYNLVNFLVSMQKEPGLTAGDKLLAVTTISFDIAGLELFLPLITGAEIVIADTASAKDGRALLDIIKQENITVMQATPYTWRIMLEAGWDKTTPVKVICGGEALPIDLANRLLDTASSLWNVYGPTETTIWSTVKKLEKDDKVISIGRPINNTSVYILDDFLKPLTPGAAGEIYIGGDGVAAGYLNRAELTAEKFVADPFSNIEGARMYRTGDLGRFMPNGEIECLGRIDAQVKIRGYRIETGEIEFQLAKESNINEAVVIAKPDKNGVNKLVAFVVTGFADESAFTAKQISEWKENLKASLPDYMVPDNFVMVPSMPLTPNGKIDKKELAKHNLTETAEETNEYIAPQTDNEKLVAGIWEEYLGLKQVSTRDNFFELGGHSLIAVQVMTRIEKETGIRLPLAALFENSTVEKLSRLLNEDAESVTWDSLVLIKKGGNKMPLYMVHGAGLNVLLFNTLAQNMDTDQPVYGLQAKGLNGIDEPLNRIEDIAEYYIQSIMKQNPDGPYALAGYSFGGIIAYEMARQFKAMGKEVKMLAMFDTYAYRSPHFDAPLIKAYKKARFFKDKIIYAFKFENGLKGMQDRARSLKRKIIRNWWRVKNGKKQQNQVGFFGYSNKIDEMNMEAEKFYQLKPQDVTVEVFRAEHRTFYMDDFEYLGWKPYALKGVNIHKIPGEHNTIFQEPNDKIFAKVLQDCLNNAAK